MKSKSGFLLNLVVVLAMVLAAWTANALAETTAIETEYAPIEQQASPGQQMAVSAADEANFFKLQPALRELARAGGDETVYVRITGEVDEIGDAFDGIVQAVPRKEPDAATGQQVWYGRMQAHSLTKLAGLEGVSRVEHIVEQGPKPRFTDPDQGDVQPPSAEQVARLYELRDNPPAPNPRPQPEGWWDVGPGHESRKAWDKGYTGEGVRVAVIDDGVDFAHPDLQGTWAVYEENLTGVPYYDYFVDWPIAFSPVSNYLMAFDYFFNGTLTDLNAFAYGISFFADTRVTGTGNTITFDGQQYTTTGTAHPFNPFYHIGYHPDASLEYWWWGERVGVLVVDENGDFVYDTVYVDLNDNHDFSDDKPATRSDPISYWDADLDGYPDLSGGMVYFIADGNHWPMGYDWWWNWSGSDPYPGNGDLVAFMIGDPVGHGTHGTLCASNVVGQGRIDGNAPPWKPSGVGGLVQGAARDAKLIAIADAYWLFTSSTEDAWYFSILGVDGYSLSDDGAHITSNSYGSSDADDDEWDWRSRLITYLNTRAPGSGRMYEHVSFLHSTGNGAPGYGTVSPPTPSTGIRVGASTQFGSTGWDNPNGPDQIEWGDVIPWSNRGPTAMGKLAPHVTADGAYAAGSLTLNASGDGWTSWQTWGGTSRSSPVAAGNLALIYDAWKQRTGSWPTWQQARQLLMNGATDQLRDVLVQGAGAVNADRSTDIAGGLYGLHTDPETWYVGDYRGSEHLAFAEVIVPCESDTEAFTLNNFSPFAITAELTATHLTEIGSYTFTVDADSADEDPASGNPDYFFDVTQYAPSGIPAEADLMVAELIYPFDQFEPQDDNDSGNNNIWRFLWYNWTDVNGNGKLWTDLNGNGVVNSASGELELGEFVRMNDNVPDYLYRMISVHDPLNRMHDGLYLGLRHFQHVDTEVPVTHLTIRVTFYERSAWGWVGLSDPPQVTVPANGSATFTAEMEVPCNTPYGVYDGAIEVAIPDHGPHSGYTTIIPIVANVAFAGDLTAAPLTLGGTPKADTRYDNGYVTGAQDWAWRAESGDWRFYFLDQTTDPGATWMIVRDEWDDLAPETDIDTLVFGPSTEAVYIQNRTLAYGWLDFSVTDPVNFGPYRLAQTGGSQNTYLGSGVWGFQTSTGGNVEYVAAPLLEGLNEVVQHTTRFEGDKFAAPFTKTVSTLSGPASPLVYTNFFTDAISFSSNVAYADSLDISVYGKSTALTEFVDEPIEQDPTNGDECDWSAGGVWNTTVTIDGNVAELGAHVYVGNNDLDLFVLYDADGDGFDCPADTIGSSTNSAGTDDEVVVAWPEPGDYMVLVQGWDVSPSPSPFDLDLWQVNLDDSLAIRNADLSIGPSKDATFELYNKEPEACSDVMAECNDGVMYVGLPEAPALIEIPIIVNYAGASLAGSTKLVDQATATWGDVLTYTVELVNDSDVYPVTGGMLTDTLPAEVTFGGIVSGGASYDTGLNAVLWSGDVLTSSVHTVVYTATVDTCVADGTVIANTADLENGLGYVMTTDPAETTVESVNLESSAKSADKTRLATGETLLYTLDVVNSGPVATTAYVTDTLPAAVMYLSGSGGVSHSDGVVTWSGAIGANATVPITFEVQVQNSANDGDIIVNAAQVGDACGATWQTDAVTTLVSAPALEVIKGVSATSVEPGDVLTYTVNVWNVGGVAAGVNLTDTLPAGLTLLNVWQVSGPGAVTHSDNVVNYSGTLNPLFTTDYAAVIQYSAKVTDSLTMVLETLTNEVMVKDAYGHSASDAVDVRIMGSRLYLPIVLRSGP